MFKCFISHHSTQEIKNAKALYACIQKEISCMEIGRYPPNYCSGWRNAIQNGISRTDSQTLKTCQPRELLPLKPPRKLLRRRSHCHDCIRDIRNPESGSHHYHKCLPSHKTSAWILEHGNSFFITRKLEKRNWNADCCRKMSYLHDLDGTQKSAKHQKDGLIPTWAFQISYGWIFLVGVN